MAAQVMGLSPAAAAALESSSCTLCHKTGPRFKSCGRCLAAPYCSPECQKQHWPEHKAVCKARADVAEALVRRQGEEFLQRQSQWVTDNRPALTALVHKVLGEERLKTHVLTVATVYQPNQKPYFLMSEAGVHTLEEIAELNAGIADTIKEHMAEIAESEEGAAAAVSTQGFVAKTGYAAIFVHNVPGAVKVVPLAFEAGGAEKIGLSADHLAKCINAGIFSTSM